MPIKIYSDYEDSNIAVDEVNRLYRTCDTESARKLKEYKGGDSLLLRSDCTEDTRFKFFGV